MANFTKIASPRGDWPKITTPIGKAIWPKLNVPDFGNANFPKPAGEYSVTLRLSNRDAAPVIARIEEFYVAAYAAQCKAEKRKLKEYNGRPFADAEDRKKGGERVPVPGFTDFSIKRKATRKVFGKMVPQHVQLLDASGSPMNDPIFGGSQLRVACVATPWFMPANGFGVRLELIGAKVIELVSIGGVAISDFDGFTEAEEGFTSEATTTDGETQAGDADGGAEGGSDVDDASDF